MLALAYGCGLRAGEVARLKAGDIDSAQGIIRVVQSKGRKDRHVMLPQEVLPEMLMLSKSGRVNIRNRTHDRVHKFLRDRQGPSGQLDTCADSRRPVGEAEGAFARCFIPKWRDKVTRPPSVPN
jgi:integrase